MLRTVWKFRHPRSIAHYANLKMADYVSRRSGRLVAVRNNRQMAIIANDYIGHHINHFGYFEHEELRNLFAFLSPLNSHFKSGVALDIGANIGNHTLYFSNLFRKVHAFEPDPRVYELLEFNSSPVSNVVAHSFGLSDSRCDTQLNQDSVNSGLSSMKYGVGENGNSIAVKVDRLDSLNCSGDVSSVDMSDVCFVKIDVEGFEERVIRGAMKTLEANQPLVVLEQQAREFSDGTSPSITLLRELGYGFVWQQKKRLSKLWVGRRIVELWQVCCGADCRFVSSEVVPAANYTMLIAVPPRFQEMLGFK